MREEGREMVREEGKKEGSMGYIRGRNMVIDFRSIFMIVIFFPRALLAATYDNQYTYVNTAQILIN